MMRSLYSAVSGLKNHQTKMDVIGNNISNVNTVAFKSSAVTFKDIIYQNLSGASGASANIGGVNAKQIGLGVSTAATAVKITTAGAAQTTGNAFDLRLTDSSTTNFFIVDSGSGNLFTRAGAFYIDGNGTLCMDSTGYRVMGWQVDPKTQEIKKDTVSPLEIMKTENLTSTPEATERAYASGIIDKNSPDLKTDDGYIMTLNFYDEKGYPYTGRFAIKEVYDESTNPATLVDGKYEITLTSMLDQNNEQVLPHKIVDGKTYISQAAADSIFPPCYAHFSTEDGSFIGMTTKGSGAAFPDTSFDPTKPDTFTKELQINLKGDGTIQNKTDYAVQVPDPASPGSMTTDNGQTTTWSDAFHDITIDFSYLLNENNSTVSTAGMNRGTSATDNTDAGKKLGALTGLSVQNNGKIYGTYDNGNTVLLGQIAVAQFSNASGLEKVGESCYATTLNSGEFDGIGVEINADGSKMTSGELEMSNVDLSTEFTDMITTQRGFQANSRVITTSDSLLEELISLKR